MAIPPGLELKVALTLRGKTGRQVARQAGISSFELSRILNGRQPADPAKLARIRRAIFDEPEAAA